MAIKSKPSSQKYVLRIPTDGGEIKVHADKLMEALVRILDGLGDFVSTLGEIETDYPNLVEGLRKISDDPALLEQFTESLKPEVLQQLLVVVLRLMRISPDLNTLTSLSAQRKVALGHEIKSISGLLKKLEVRLKES